jgi:hypothetical protein
LGEIFSIAGVLRRSSFCKILKVKDYVDAAVIPRSKLTATIVFAVMLFVFLLPGNYVFAQAPAPGNMRFLRPGLPLAAPGSALAGTGSPLASTSSPFGVIQSPLAVIGLPPDGKGSPFGGINSPLAGIGSPLTDRGSILIRNGSSTQLKTLLVPGRPYSIHLPEDKSRLWIVAGSHAAIWTGTFIALNHAWYRDYPKSSFHFFDDRMEWHQMDKAGHVWTTYQLSRHSAASWKWAGMTERQSAWLGGSSAFAFQSIIEILDGFSAEWGFSIGDMEANLIGAGGFVAQQLLFKEQLFQVKFGYNPYDYPDDLKPRRYQLFGTSLPEQLLKDYNSQRYWLSANLKSISGSQKLPAWLNLAFGYSSDALYGANSNVWTDEQGNHFDRSDIPRIRRFYLSPDIDLTKIKTKSKFFRSVFFILNMVKIPAPAVEYNTSGKLKFHPLLF